MRDLVVREYGAGGPPVIVVHGGPAAAGDLAPLARVLGERWHVLEPFQRTSGDGPLTVATHVQDLDDVIRTRCRMRPALVGHSWGAMLVLAYAAAHPASAAALVLIGCGTFSRRARAEFEARLDARLTPAQRATLAKLEDARIDDDRRAAAIGRLMTDVYGYDVLPGDPEGVSVDAKAHHETWADMVRLQDEGTYPAAFAAIGAPVLMLHGDVDPHPGGTISEELGRYLPQLDYRELTSCGHSPWLERRARDTFLDTLDDWLSSLAGRW